MSIAVNTIELDRLQRELSLLCDTSNVLCRFLLRAANENPRYLDCMPPGMDDPPAFVVEIAQQPGIWETAVSEGEHFDSCFDELKAIEHAPFFTPLIILTASEQEHLDHAALIDWIAGHKRMAALSTRGEQRLVTGSSHAIQLDRPQAVVQAIRDAIK